MICLFRVCLYRLVQMDSSLEDYIRKRVSDTIHSIKEGIGRLAELWIYYQEFGGRDFQFLGTYL